MQQNRATTAAEALGVQPRFVEARRSGDIDTAFAAMTRNRPDAVLVLGDPMFNSERGRIASLALRSRMPVIHWVRDFTDAGGLIRYGPDLRALYQRAATYVDKILKGAPRVTCPLSSRRSSNLRSTSRPPRPLA